MRILGAVLVVLLIASGTASAQVTQDDLAEARAELEQLRIDTLELAVLYEQALATDLQLAGDIDQLEGIIAGRRLELRDLRERAQVRAVEMYIDAAGIGLATVFSATSPNELDTRSEYLGYLGKADQAVFNGLQILSIQLTSETEQLEAARVEQAASVAALEEVAADLNARLEQAQGTYNDLYDLFLEEERARLAEEERLRRIAEEQARAAEEAARNATSTTNASATTNATTATTVSSSGGSNNDGTRTCPINGFTSFTDTWGAPRSGGRWHQGVDMLAARGTPVVAVEDGVVDRMRNSSRGGITVWLRTNGGDEFYYAHLDSWAPGLSVGQAVSVGQKLGEVGTTGNAPAHIPHLHWEYHPGGGGAVNPTPLASALCG